MHNFKIPKGTASKDQWMLVIHDLVKFSDERDLSKSRRTSEKDSLLKWIGIVSSHMWMADLYEEKEVIMIHLYFYDLFMLSLMS